jgi:hypothetical protein
MVFWRFACLRRKREGCLVLKPEIFTSLLIVLMGSADCVTTFIGILYSGAAELNPFMAGIVSTNIAAFLTIKMAATFLMGFTCIQANKTLMKTRNRSTKVFKYSCKLIKIAYAGIIVFLVIVVANNLLILLA